MSALSSKISNIGKNREFNICYKHHKIDRFISLAPYEIHKYLLPIVFKKSICNAQFKCGRMIFILKHNITGFCICKFKKLFYF